MYHFVVLRFDSVLFLHCCVLILIIWPVTVVGIRWALPLVLVDWVGWGALVAGWVSGPHGVNRFARTLVRHAPLCRRRSIAHCGNAWRRRLAGRGLHRPEQHLRWLACFACERHGLWT